MESFLHDLRHGLRLLAKNRTFTAVAVLALALGIGANTAIFTVVDAALLRPLPYAEPDRLVHLWETASNREFRRSEASYPNFLDFRARGEAFESLAGYNRTAYTISNEEGPRRVAATRVTANFFDTLGVAPALGRAFREGEDEVGAPAVVVLSHGAWVRRFGANPSVVGSTIQVDGVPAEIVGVLPASFQFAPAGAPEIWTTIDAPATQRARRTFRWLNVVGRLRPGVTVEQAASSMESVAARMRDEYPEFTGRSVAVAPLRDAVVGNVRPVMWTLLGAVGFVLLIACANVANLLLARATERAREVAVRSALGATRARLVRQFLTESLLLATAGGLAGLAFARWGVDALVAAIPEAQLRAMPYLEGLSLDARVFAFAGAVSLATGVVFGLVPALHASRADALEALKSGGRSSAGPGRGKLRDVLVVAEVALALVLLAGAGLMIESTSRLLAVDPGFDVENLLTLRVLLPSSSYAEPDRVAAYHEELLSRVGSLPGVRAAGTVDVPPLFGGSTTSFAVHGLPTPEKGSEPEANVRTVSASYFATAGIPLARGRAFDARDRLDSAKVVVVNETLARRVFGGEDPVGRQIVIDYGTPTRYEIVGVAGDEKLNGLDAPTTSVLYFAFLQEPDPGMTLLVRTTGDPTAAAGTVRDAIHSLDAGVPIFGESSVEQTIASAPSTFLRRYPALLIGSFAVVALALAVIGIYGVISYSVTQRTRELGVRIALGARPGDLFRLVAGRGLTLAAAGIAVGVGLALALARLLSSLLFEVSPSDPLTYAGASALLLAVAALACYVPARRASRVDPIDALKYE